jgi:hypothetical protein
MTCAFERDYRSRLVAYLGGQLRDLRAGVSPDEAPPRLAAASGGAPKAAMATVDGD